LGHVISDEEIKVDPKKIMAVTKWPSPNSITSSRGFLGLTRYYRRFVQNYAQIVAPLKTLVKKYVFKWNDEAVACFTKLKLLMTSTLVFTAPNFYKTFVLKCDAS
jgi:hypothetical protein